MTQNMRLHKKPAPAASASPPSQAPPAARAGMSSGGSALDTRTQATMSARFGHDFSSVRVHTDARAGQSAEALGANAYAVGTDIVFGDGKYAPGSSDGQRLLAHELTHVAQQQTLGGGDWGRSSRRGDASEREADGLASQVMMGRSVQVQAAPQAAVARDENSTEDSSGGPPPPESERPTKVPVDDPVLPGLKPIPGGDMPPGLENPIEFPKPPPLPFIPGAPPGGFPKPPPTPASPPASSGGGVCGAIEEGVIGFGSRLGSFLPPVPKWLFHPDDVPEA